MKKRVLAVILVSVLTIGMVGCADKSKEEKHAEENAVAAEET